MVYIFGMGRGLNFLGYGILVQKKVNEFAYSKALLFFIEDFDFFKNNTNMDIYFKQDGSTPHTSQSNQFLIKKLFGDSFIVWKGIYQKIELKGERLEPYHLNLIQKELNKEPEEQEEKKEKEKKRINQWKLFIIIKEIKELNQKIEEL